MLPPRHKPPKRFRNFRWLRLLCLVCGVIGAAAAQRAPSIRRLDGSRLPFQQTDSILATLMKAGRVEGLAVAVINNNRPVYLRAFGLRSDDSDGPIDTATVLYAASFSKAVFACLSMKLVEKGLLDLDRPLARYLKKPLPDYPAYRQLKDDDRWRFLTPRMCLSHTTGLPNVRWIDARTGEPDTAGTLRIYFPPGTRYAYSGEGLKLLQLAEEEITGRSLESLATDFVFRPAGMRRSGYVWHEGFDDNWATGHDGQGRLHPKKHRSEAVASGSLVTTIADYSRFVCYVMQRKNLGRKYWNEMFRPQIRIYSAHQFPTITGDSSGENRGISLSYGLGWGLLRSPCGKAFFKEGHDEAWRNYNINFPERGTAIVIMTSSAHGEGIFKPLLEALIGDVYTPWKWEDYLPYNYSAQ